jgi:hypothetical protein
MGNQVLFRLTFVTEYSNAALKMDRKLEWEVDMEALEGPADMMVCGEERRRGVSISSRPSTAHEATQGCGWLWHSRGASSC